jgi:nucleotide-binding universal stress UspA family protein
VSQKGVFCNLEDKKKQLIHLADEKAREILVTAGFNEKNVKTKTQTTGKGVAGDILKEAAEGYDTIVMGRRGLSGIKEFLLGSVSQKVIHGSKNISLVLVE